MPRFSLKRLFVSFTLVAVGTAIIAWSFRLVLGIDHTQLPHKYILLIFLFSGPLVGLGLSWPFKRPAIGLYFGVCLQVILLGLLFAFSIAGVS